MPPKAALLKDQEAALLSSDPKARQKACAALVDWPNRREHARAIELLLPLLDDGVEKVVKEAFCALASLHCTAPQLLARAVAVVTDRKFGKATRTQATYALAELGADAVPALVAVLPLFQDAAGYALKRVGRSARPEDLLPLLELAQSGDKDVAAEAFETLAEIRIPLPGLVELCRKTILDAALSTRSRIAAANLLGGFKCLDARGDLQRAAEQAHEREPGFLISRPSWAAAAALASFAEDGWGHLKPILESQNPWAVIAALDAFQAWRSPNSEAIALIFAHTSHPNARVREEALATIDLLGLVGGGHSPAATDRLAPILANLADPDWEVRQCAADSLGDLDLAQDGSEADRVVPALIAAIDDEDFRVRETAVAALEWWNEKAAPAVPRLMRLLAERQQWLEESERIAGPGAREIIEQAMADPDRQGGFDSDLPVNEELLPWVVNYRGRLRAVACLESIGLPGAAAAVPLLHQLLNDPLEDKTLLPSIQAALAELEPDSTEAIASALKGLNSRRGEEIYNALDLVTRIAVPPPELITSVGKQLNPKAKHRLKALWVCRDAGPVMASLAPRVVALFSADGPAVAAGAVQAFAALGAPETPGATDGLLSLLERPDLEVRTALAADAARLGPEFARRAAPLLAVTVEGTSPLSFRGTAALALANLGHESEPVRATLRAVAEDRPDFGYLGDIEEMAFGILQSHAAKALARPH